MIGLTGATFSTNNMGVGALTSGAIRCVLHGIPNARIFLLDYGRENRTVNFYLNKNKKIPIQLLNMRFSKYIYLHNNVFLLILTICILKLIPWPKIRNKYIDKNYYLNSIKKFDIVASLSGGDSFSDIYGIQRFFYVSLPQILVLLLDKDLVLLPQTIGPFKRRITKVIARYIMNHARIIFSRDYKGIEETRSLLGLQNNSDKIKFCYDVGFVLEPIRPDKLDLGSFSEVKNKDNVIVGVNISGLLFMGGYTHDNMFGLRVNYKDLVYEIIDYLINEKDFNVLLIPHVFGSIDDPESDFVISNKIHQELKLKYKDKLYCVHSEYNQHEIKYIIGLCDLFIGARMHACIAALSQNIPAIAIAYSEKFIGVMETIGVEYLVADPRKLGKDEIISIIDTAYKQRVLIKEHLEKTIPKVKESVLNLFQEIDQLFQKK